MHARMQRQRIPPPMRMSLRSVASAATYLLVEPDDRSDPLLAEDRVVVLWRQRVQPVANLEPRRRRAGERDEFSGQDLVEIAVLDFLIIFIFFVVKILEFIPTVTNSYL